MNDFFQKVKKNLLAVLFVGFIGVFFLGSFPKYAMQIGQEVYRRALYGGGAFISLSDLFESMVPFDKALVNVNGGFARIMGLRCLNERYVLDDGQITYLVPEVDTEPLAQETIAMQEALADRQIPFTYVCAPFKVNPHNKGLPAGIEDYSNEDADSLLQELRKKGVDCLDLRDAIFEQGLNYTDMFFYTDHHWRTEYGLWATEQIVNHLSAHDAAFCPAQDLYAKENYLFTNHPKSFYGSVSERVGKWYHAADDMIIVEPKFETALDFSVPEDNLYQSGAFRGTVLSDSFNGYNSYCGKLSGLITVRNRSAQMGLPVCSTPKKLLIVGDSYCQVVLPFMSLAYDETALIDLRIFEQDLLEYIDDFSPDYVLIVYNPGVFSPSNRVMFEFVN